MAQADGTRARHAAAPKRTRAGSPSDPPAAPDPEATPQAVGLARALSPGGVTGPTAVGPVIVLTYGFAGGRRLQELLSHEPGLACTTRTGILAAVGHAADAWQHVEERVGERMSALAAASIRALVNPMLTVITARTGGRRWCETAAVDPIAVAAFLQVFPDTKIICLHRTCPDVVFALLAANPWGLSGEGFAAYLASHPASTAAALAAWWADQAGPLLDFEAAYPRACMRVRYEDLIIGPGQTLAAIRGFLGLAPGSGGAVPEPGPHEAVLAKPDAPGCGGGFPVGQIPPKLADRVNALLARLDYPPLSADPRPG